MTYQEIFFGSTKIWTYAKYYIFIFWGINLDDRIFLKMKQKKGSKNGSEILKRTKTKKVFNNKNYDDQKTKNSQKAKNK